MFILGICNIVGGFLLLTIVTLIQAFFFYILSFVYVLTGVLLLFKYYKLNLLLYIILFLNILFSINMIGLATAKDIPEYFKTPIWIAISLIILFWSIFFTDYYFLKKRKKGKMGKMDGSI